MEKISGMVRYKNTSVAIAVPCGSPVEPRVFQTGMAIVGATVKAGHDVQIATLDRVVVHTARNFLTKAFLDTDCEWVFWMDSDMILPSNTINVLLKWAQAQQAVWMTGVYYQRQGEHKPLVLRRLEGVSYNDPYTHNFIHHASEQTTPYEVDCAGFGVMLIHRSVIEAMEYPYFKFKEMSNGHEASEDFYFCATARSLGFKLWAVPELECFHLGAQELIGRQHFVDKTDPKDLHPLFKEQNENGKVHRTGNGGKAADSGARKESGHMDDAGNASTNDTSALPGARLRLRFSGGKQNAKVVGTDRRRKAASAPGHDTARAKASARNREGIAGVGSAAKLAPKADRRNAKKDHRRIAGKTSAA